MKKAFACLILCFCLLACATAEKGRKFDAGQANQIEIGKTTESDVIATMGQPYRSQTLSNGEKIFVYGHAQATVKPFAKIKSDLQKFTITFDKAGIVKAIEKEGI